MWCKGYVKKYTSKTKIKLNNTMTAFVNYITSREWNTWALNYLIA